VYLSVGLETLLALLMGVLGSAACAGIPGGGIMIAAMTMSILGLPMEPVGWIAGVYTLIDMPEYHVKRNWRPARSSSSE